MPLLVNIFITPLSALGYGRKAVGFFIIIIVILLAFHYCHIVIIITLSASSY